MNKLQFYSSDVCPFAYRVRLALHEKAIPHEMISVDLENIPDWYYKISPTGRAPLLKQGDQVIWESTVIMNSWKTRILTGLCYQEIPLHGRMHVFGSNTAITRFSQASAV